MFKKPVFKTLNLIEISKDGILNNFYAAKKAAPNCDVWPVLKSNAYGHGIEQIASILRQEKFGYFVVDSYFEAIKIRKISNRNILIIGSTNPVNFRMMDFKNLTLMVQDVKSIEVLGKLNKKLKIHLKINTGMNRQGFDLEELEMVVKMLKRFPLLEVEGVFSHLADSDNDNDSFTRQQENNFKIALDKIYDFGLNPKYVHLSATYGLGKTVDYRINAARLGIGLYGFGDIEGLKPALRMVSVFTKARGIEAGDKVSYNCTFTADQKMNIGIIPVGYNEVLDRRLGNKGWVKYKEKFYPMIGKICMNLSIINLKKEEVKEFEEVEIISWNSSDKNSVLSMAEICSTIPYEILVRINGTIRRVVV